ncbi:MAG: 50S ribosomal protein P1 [Euryarchaeota archaeon]|nr:50S ribosomal protein P1 [Euryarchaeota archaeon]
MEYVYAALLIHSSGKDVSEEGIKTILDAAGITPDDVRIKALVSALEGVDVDSVLSQASTVSAPVVPTAAPAAEAAPAVEEIVEEEKEEEAEESGMEGLGALFG